MRRLESPAREQVRHELDELIAGSLREVRRWWASQPSFEAFCRTHGVEQSDYGAEVYQMLRHSGAAAQKG